MSSSTSHTRRRRAQISPAFSIGNLSSFLGHETCVERKPQFSQKICRAHESQLTIPSNKNQAVKKRASKDHALPLIMVAAAPSSAPSKPRRISRFSQPVPEAKPHEILSPQRGRNSRRRTREAEHFRKYIYLRKQLKPWSDEFRAKHGRPPSLIDVDQAHIPGLLDRFKEYLDALEGLRFDV